MPDRKQVQIAANVNSYNRRRTKTGKDMITINASDVFGNIDAVAFGDASFEFAQILSGESVILLSGRVSNRDDRVSVFVDAITPLSEWVCRVARKMILDVHNQAVLPDVKNILSALPAGNTNVILNLHNDKVVSLALPRGVILGSSTAADLIALGVRVEIE
jgi:DNA polymerase-3 subunit alpha